VLHPFIGGTPGGLAGALLGARFLGRRTPLLVAWALTYACNRRCSYCRRWQPARDELDTRRIGEIIEVLARRGCASISLTGGEPLTRPDLGEIIDLAHARSIKVKLNTNGALVPSRVADLEHLDTLCLSLDGPQPVHDAIRGPGAFDEVAAAARSAAERGLHLTFTSVISAANPGAQAFVLEFARGVDASVLFQPATPQVRGASDGNPLTPCPETVREAVDFLARRKRDGDRTVGNSFAGLRHLAAFPGPRPIACASGFVSCRIEPGGEVRHCGLVREGFTPRSCLEAGFDAAFDALPSLTCGDCWCAGRVELNLAFGGSPSAVANQLAR
jgi:MoaA/NifB/PqqE/SkfB family radical SAM enzyme